MTDIEKMNLESKDLVADRIEQLKSLFPEISTEDSIDFDKLRLILGDEVEAEQERYAFTWPGKAAAIRQSQTVSTAALRPRVDKSRGRDGKDGSFDSDNIYIEGDNLEVLKLLQRGYHGKIKMIYIDPPYNTGHDFVYKDKFGDTIANYKEQAGLAGQSNADTSGRYHSDWCSMMYPRLRLARELLTDDGFIAISISEEEETNLRNICNEIFGEINFRNRVAVRRYDKNINLQFATNGLTTMNVGLEYIFIYSKLTTSKMSAVYRATGDERAKTGYWKGFWNNADRPTMRYSILGVTPDDGQWKWKKEIADEAVKNYKEYLQQYSKYMSLEQYWSSTGKTKRFLRRNPKGAGKNQGVEHWVSPSEGTLRNSNWSDMLVSKPAGNNIIFDSPKNPELIRTLIDLFDVSDNERVLDFFSGSATTAHAVLLNNILKETSSQFILIQLPESIDSNKDNFKNICQLGEERIRRAGDKIKAELEQESSQLKLDEEPKTLPDIGFRVFSLDESGIEKPEPGQLMLDVVKPDRSELDIVFEMMLKWGLELTHPVEKTQAAGYPIWSVACDELICCMSPGLTSEAVEAIAAMEPRRVLILDSILSDTLKLNTIQTFKHASERMGYEIELRTV